MATVKLTSICSRPERLEKKGIKTCRDFLLTDSLELMDVLEVAYPHLQKVQLQVSSRCAPKCYTALEMYQQTNRGGGSAAYLSTRVQGLDASLRGGLPPRTVTEIAGAPGSGKTQLCLTLAIAAVLAQPTSAECGQSSVMYIDTEGAFSAERLLEVTIHQLQSDPPLRHSKGRFLLDSLQGAALTAVGKVLTMTALTCEKFLACLDRLESVLPGSGLRLVVVDSIASLARKEFDVSSGRGVMDRTEFLLRVSAKLKYLAGSFGLQVVVTNQIYASPNPVAAQEGLGGVSGVGVVTPALGTAWYHCVNTRLLLEFCEEGGAIRKLVVDKSPVCGREQIFVEIAPGGVVMRGSHNSLDNNDWSSPAASSDLTIPLNRDFPFEFPGNWQ